MADDQRTTNPDSINEKPSPKRIYKKTTSKRRALNITAIRKVETSNDKKCDSSSSAVVSPISERTVIGQEAELKPVESAEVVLKNVQGILNRSSLKKCDFSNEIRSEADGREDSTHPDIEIEELSKLRCPSECTEAVAEREKRRRQRCADYPGLAFGSSVFGSDTLMKFSVIKNELHNILKSQLKRAESEVVALNRRIQSLNEDLGRSEECLTTATIKLAEASQAADEAERIRKALENSTSMEDDKVAMFESLFAKQKLIAEEANKTRRKISEQCAFDGGVYMGTLETQLSRFLSEGADKSKCDEIVDEFLLFKMKHT